MGFRAGFGSNGHARLVYVALVIASLIYCLPLFSRLDLYGRHDWDQFSFRYETPRLALLRDHQVPLWNPYVNGGTVLLAHPESPFPSPWYLLVLALGAPLGLKVQVALFMALGATGMAALLRRSRVPLPGCFLGGVIFTMSAHFALQIAEGHLEWCVLGLMPWLVLCVLRAAEDRRFVVIGALLLASVVTFGSVYILAVYLPFLSVWAALESIRRRSWRLALGWGGAVVLALLLSAVKLLPQLEFVGGNPREVEAEGFAPRGFVDVLLNPRQVLLNQATHDVLDRARLGGEALRDYEATGRKFDVYARSLPEPVAQGIYNRLSALGLAKWKWHEYGGYVTYLGLAMAVGGVAMFWRTQWPLYVSGFLAAVTMLGNGSPIDLWTLLQRLPLFGQLRVPSRFLAALVFVLAVAAGHGLGWLYRRTARTDRRTLQLLVACGVPIAVYIELAILGWALFGDVFVGRPVQLPHYEQFASRYTTMNSENPRLRGYFYTVAKSNSGVLKGYENLQVKRGGVRTVDDPRYRGEAYLDGSTKPVAIREWTMARVKVAFETQDADSLVLNQNSSKGWRGAIRGSGPIRVETATAGASGLVTIPVRPGDREVEFYYRPASFVTGAWISGVTLLGCVVVLRGARMRRNRR